MKVDIAEYLALIVLGTIAIVAMCQLGIKGKEIPLAVCSGIIGYLAKSGINAIRGVTRPPEKPEKDTD